MEVISLGHECRLGYKYIINIYIEREKIELIIYYITVLRCAWLIRVHNEYSSPLHMLCAINKLSSINK